MKIRTLFTIIMLSFFGRAFAQTEAEEERKDVSFTLGTDIVSGYVWRGLELGSAAIQPCMEISWKGLSLSAWGSIGFVTVADAKEIDLTASYSFRNLCVGVVDYWSSDADIRYFHYKQNSTAHVLEGFVSYDFGIFNASWQTIFYGNDGVNKDDKRAYSSYFELNVPFRLATCDWQATVGLVPYASSYYETTGIGLTNLSLRASKELRITDHFAIPLFAQLTANPYSRNAYFICGITLAPHL